VTYSQSRKQRAQQEKLLRKVHKEIPVLELAYDPMALVFHGPIINTNLTITDQHHQALATSGQPKPQPVRCRFLIDTGADGCVVKHEIAEQAGLKLINPSSPLHGVGVDTTGRTYFGRVQFIVDSRHAPGVKHTFSVDAEIQSGDLQTDRIDGIIGRNVLNHFEMIYNGMTGKITLRIIGISAAKEGPPEVVS
jgi:Aspartyl protease